MTVETKEPKPKDGNEDTPETTPAPSPPTGGTWRDEPGAQAVFKQLADLKAERNALKEAESLKEKQEENERLKAASEFEQLSNKLQAEAESDRARYATEIRTLKLKAELAGMNDELALLGAMSKCPDDADPLEYAAEFKAANPQYWTAPPPPGTPPAETRAQGAAAGTIKGVTPAEIKRLCESDDREERLKGNRLTREYRLEHGHYPD